MLLKRKVTSVSDPFHTGRIVVEGFEDWVHPLATGFIKDSQIPKVGTDARLLKGFDGLLYYILVKPMPVVRVE